MSTARPAREAAPGSVAPRLVLLATGMFTIGTDSYVIAPLLPHMARDLDVGIATAAQLVTAYALTYALASPFVATATAHWPRERALVTGLAIFVAANAGAAVAPGFALLLAARAFAGLGAALFAPVASACAAGMVPAERRGRALSFMMVGLTGATALGAPLGTLIGSAVSWRAVLLLVAALGTAVALAVVLSPRSGAAVDGASIGERLRPLREAGVLTTLVVTFLVLTGLYISYTYISVIFDRATGSDGACLAILQSIWGVAGILGATMAGRLTDRWGGAAVIRITLLVLFVDFALMPWSSAYRAGAAAAMLLWGMCGLGFVVPQQHRLVANAPGSASILLALYTMAVYGGTSASGVVGAFALQFIDPHRLPLVGAGLILGGLAVDEVARSRRMREAYAAGGR
jgi:predicted MFS family arabinose efflux permease